MIAIVLAATLLSPAAAPKKVALIKNNGAPAAWVAELQKAAEEREPKAWVAPPAVSLDDAAAALGCAWGPACAGQIASMTGAASALVVELDGGDGGVKVHAFVVKANGNVGESVDAGPLPTDTDGLQMARVAVQGALTGNVPAWIYVDTDEPGAEIVLDGAPKGKTPTKLTVEPGEHKVVLKREGRAPISETVKLKAGEVLRMTRSIGGGGTNVGIEPKVGDGPDGSKDKVIDVPVEQPPPTVSASPLTWPALIGGALLTVVGAIPLVASTPAFLDIMDTRPPTRCGDNLDCVAKSSSGTGDDVSEPHYFTKTAANGGEVTLLDRCIGGGSVCGQQRYYVQPAWWTGVFVTTLGVALTSVGVVLLVTPTSTPTEAGP